MSIFDAIAKFFSTSGKRWDGTSYADKSQPLDGYDPVRKDFLPPNFGSQVRQHPDGAFRGVASTEMVQGPDGLWHRRFGGRPRRRIDDSFLK
jgi:hypothetical protein